MAHGHVFFNLALGQVFLLQLAIVAQQKHATVALQVLETEASTTV